MQLSHDRGCLHDYAGCDYCCYCRHRHHYRQQSGRTNYHDSSTMRTGSSSGFTPARMHCTSSVHDSAWSYIKVYPYNVDYYQLRLLLHSRSCLIASRGHSLLPGRDETRKHLCMHARVYTPKPYKPSNAVPEPSTPNCEHVHSLNQTPT